MKQRFTLLLVASCMLAGSAIAQPMQTKPHIRVAGEAKLERAPDQAIFSVTLQHRNKVLAEAKRENDQTLDKLIATATSFDIPRSQLQPSRLSISPQYRYENESGKQFLTGYMVNRSLQVTLDDIDSQEKLLSAMLDAGVERIGDVQFRLKDEDKQRELLYEKAYLHAKQKARNIARAAGQTLGKPIIIDTLGGGGGYSPPMMMESMAASRSSDMSVAQNLPGMITLQQTIQVTFALGE